MRLGGAPEMSGGKIIPLIAAGDRAVREDLRASFEDILEYVRSTSAADVLQNTSTASQLDELRRDVNRLREDVDRLLARPRG